MYLLCTARYSHSVPAKSMFKPERQIYTAHMVQLSSFPLRWQLSFLIEVQEGPRYEELNPIQLKANVISGLGNEQNFRL